MTHAISTFTYQLISRKNTLFLIAETGLALAAVVATYAGSFFLAMSFIGGTVGLAIHWVLSQPMKREFQPIEDPVQRAKQHVQNALREQELASTYHRINTAILALQGELEKEDNPLLPSQLPDMHENLLQTICGNRILPRDREKYFQNVEQMVGSILLSKTREYANFDRWVAWAGQREDTPWYQIYHHLYKLQTVSDVDTANETWGQLISSLPSAQGAIPLSVKNALAGVLQQVQISQLQIANFQWRQIFEQWNIWAKPLNLPTFEFP